MWIIDKKKKYIKKQYPQIDKNNIKQCQIKFSFLILNNVYSITQIKQNIINAI